MTTGRRQPLSRDVIVGGAVAFADVHGVEGLSMRRLAADLGVGAMSLYHHVANKEELLAAAVDVVAGEIATPEAMAWREAIREHAMSVRDTLRRHRWAVGLWTTTTPGPNGLDALEWLLRTLRGAGFSMESTDLAFHALNNHVVGYMLQEVAFPFSGQEELAEASAGFLDTLATDRYPEMAEHVRHHIDGPGTSSFEFVLDLVLDGIEQLR